MQCSNKPSPAGQWSLPVGVIQAPECNAIPLRSWKLTKFASMRRYTLCTVRSAMITITYLPLFVTVLFRGMPGIWKSRHRLMLCWLVVLQALFPGRKTLEELARWTPASVTVWRLRRLLNAAYWDVHLLVAWWVEE